LSLVRAIVLGCLLPPTDNTFKPIEILKILDIIDPWEYFTYKIKSPDLTKKRATGFDLRYNAHLSPSDQDWRDCSNVLSQRDFGTLMRMAWEK